MQVSNRVPTFLQEKSCEKSYADETREQRARHLEIRLEQQRRRRRTRRSPKFPNLRKRELETIFAERYGGQLPDDDAGRGDLRLMGDHLAQLSTHHVVAWACAWAPWADDDEIDILIELVGPGKHWKADALGKELNLDDAMRTRLKIRTIGAVDRTKAQRMKRCRKRKAATEAARRAEAGAVPRTMSAARLKPWEALGISRRTYYRNWARGTDGTNSCPILLESQLGTKQCHGGPPRERGVLARTVELGNKRLRTARVEREIPVVNISNAAPLNLVPRAAFGRAPTPH
jgi:hypothetical protein